MNTILFTPDVKLFVAAVREHLADLTEEEREELVGGLESDMSDLVAEQGVDALPEPREYARELRSAAGFDAESRSRSPLRQWVLDLVRRGPAEWAHLVERRPVLGTAAEIVARLAPAWWVLRAWVAVQLFDMFVGPSEYLTPVPSLGEQFYGLVALAVAIVLSVLIGVGRLWPGTHRDSRAARLVLRAANAAGVVAVLVVFSHFPSSWDSHGLYNGRIGEVSGTTYSQPGLLSDGRLVRNVFAYDASGKPVVGVQLFDQRGRPIEIDENRRLRTDDGFGLAYPWRNGNGNRDLYNVFPLPVRTQPGWEQDPEAATSSNPPTLPSQPLPVVPPATLDGVEPSLLLTKAQLTAQQAESQVREAKLAKQVRDLQAKLRKANR